MSIAPPRIESHLMLAAGYEGETDEQRDERFRQLNDRVWGRGNWVRCSTCPGDRNGREVYHHRNAHLPVRT